MPNPNIHRNVVMTIHTPIDPDLNRYMYIPYWPKGIEAFFRPLQIYDWKCLKLDRKGMVYNLATYFAIIYAIQSPHWYYGGGLYLNLALACALVAQIAAFITVSVIIGEWMKSRDLTKLSFL